MIRKPILVAAIPMAPVAAIVYAQMPIVEAVADKVVHKYQSSTCEQL
jgi:hypothetical protein